MKKTLDLAMKAFVESGADRSKMDVLRWAETYYAGPEMIRECWESAMTKHSTKPQNTYCEGK